MSNWKHKHIIDLSSFSAEDYKEVLQLANRFKKLPQSGARKLPALQGRLIATLFFEPSTRTRSSFELAAKRLSADVQSFSPSSSSLSKGETPLDTVMTYVAMGAEVLVIRHSSAGVPAQLAKYLDQKNKKVSILNGGDGLHSHPSQALLDLFTLTNYFGNGQSTPESLFGKTITIVGDILHSRVARSNLWSLTACGANVILCGPQSLLPEDFTRFADKPPSGQKEDPIKRRGEITICRSLMKALKNTDALIALRLQKERMSENLISNLNLYHHEYGITHQKLEWCTKKIPILHPGPVNRGIEMSSELLEDNAICLVNEQVSNGIPIRMALLYLLAATNIN